MAENNTINNTEKRKYRSKNYSSKKYISKISINDSDLNTENETMVLTNTEDVKVHFKDITNDSGLLQNNNESMKKVENESIKDESVKDESVIPVENKTVSPSKDLKVGKIIAKGPATITIMGEDGQGVLLKGKCKAEVGEYLEYFR